MAKLWSWSAGEWGSRVRVSERTRGGVIQIAAWDPTTNGGKGGYRRESLGHRNRAEARREARRVAAALESDQSTPANPSIGYVFSLYRRDHIPHVSKDSQKWLAAALTCWETFLGSDFRCADLGPREWDGFKRQRLTGAIDAKGHPVTENRKPLKPSSVNLQLDALRMTLNWAITWRVDGRPLLDRNPVLRLPFLRDINQSRSIWTQDRFEKVITAAEQLTMQVEWEGKRQRVPCYLADILIIAEGTGRRIGAVRQLRYSDLRLNEGQHGKVVWRAETDKTGKQIVQHIRPEVRKRLQKILRERPGLGDRPLFPAPRDASKAVGLESLTVWQRRAEKLAGVERLAHDTFHGLRRKFVTERKHMPDVDVAAAGGWRSVATMKRAYQMADEAGVLEAIHEPIRLREVGPS